MDKTLKKTTSLCVLMISFDRKILKKESNVRSRIIEQGKRVKELHVIVFSRRSHGLMAEKLSDNVSVVPTNSLSRWLYIFDAYRIGKQFFGVDLVTVQNPAEEGLVGLWLAKKLKSCLQVQVHSDFLSPAFLRLSFLNRIRRIIAFYVLPRSDCVRVVSKNIKQTLEERIPVLRGQISVLPVFIDAALLQGFPKRDLRSEYSQFDYIIVSATRFESEKNVALSLRAMSYVCKKYPRTGFLLLGDGRERSSLTHLAHSLGIEKNIVMCGWVDDVASYMKGSDLLLNTSKFEGYGMTIVEARLLGLPVVSTDVGVAKEVGADITPADPKAIGERVVLHHEGKVASVEPYTLPYKDEKSYLTGLVELWEKCV